MSLHASNKKNQIGNNLFVGIIWWAEKNSDCFPLIFVYFLVKLCTYNAALEYLKCHRDRDRMVVGFTSTYAISVYHHWWRELDSQSGRSVHNYVIVCQWLATGPPKKNWPPRYNWNILESGVKHHQTIALWNCQLLYKELLM